MKTFRIENLTTEEISCIIASLIRVLDEVNGNYDEVFKKAHINAISKVLHPIVVEDEATSLS